MKESIRTADANVQAANAAIQANEDSERRFRLEEKPYMVVRDPQFQYDVSRELRRGGQGRTIGLITNVGKGIAFGEMGMPATILLEFETMPSEQERNQMIDIKFGRWVRKKFDDTEKSGTPIPMRDISPDGGATVGAYITKPLPQDQADKILQRKAVLVFMGLIKYSSFDGSKHETEFCWFYDGLLANG